MPDFVVQGGDPTESGEGGPGFTTAGRAREPLDGAGFVAGGVGIADAGRDSGGSQWFVMHSRAPHLDGRYTWIGAVVERAEVRGCVADRRPGRDARPSTSMMPEPQIARTAALRVSSDACKIDRRAASFVRNMRHASPARRASSLRSRRRMRSPSPRSPSDDRDFESPPPAFQLLGRPIGGAKPATATAGVPDRLADRRGRRRRARDRRRQRPADPHRQAPARTSRSSRSAANAGLLAYDPTREARVRRRSRWQSHRGRQGRRPSSSSRATIDDAGRAVRRRAVARSQDRAGHDDRRSHARRVRRRDRHGEAGAPRSVASRAASRCRPTARARSSRTSTTGTVDQIDLLETHSAEHVALSTASTPRRCRRCGNDGDSVRARLRSRSTFMGEHEAVVPFQRETPVQIDERRRAHRQLRRRLRAADHAPARVPRPRPATAPAADHRDRSRSTSRARSRGTAAHDALYVAGMGTDSILQVKNASQVGIAEGLVGDADHRRERAAAPTASRSPPTATCSCGARSRAASSASTSSTRKGELATGDEGRAGPDARRVGADRRSSTTAWCCSTRAEPQISQRGALACASCHPDGRADGLSWRIDKQRAADAAARRPHRRHAPVQVGRRRHGPRRPASTIDDEAPRRHRPRQDADRRARRVPRGAAGAAHADARRRRRSRAARSCSTRPRSAAAAATTARRTPIRSTHKFAGARCPRADTPSLVGLAASAPYFHDGSAATLEALLRDRGAVHGMAETAKLERRAGRGPDRVPRDAIAARRSCRASSSRRRPAAYRSRTCRAGRPRHRRARGRTRGARRSRRSASRRCSDSSRS